MAQLHLGWGHATRTQACDRGTGLRSPQPEQQGEELSSLMSLVPWSGTHMHGKDAAGDELSMLADAEMPRLYPHHVIEHEFQVQPPLHTHLGRAQGQAQAAPASPSLDPLGTHCCILGHPPGGLSLPAMRLATSQTHNGQGITAKRVCWAGRSWLGHVGLQHGTQEAKEISVPRPVGPQLL